MSDLSDTSGAKQLPREERLQHERVDEIIGPEVCALLRRVDERERLEAVRGLKALALAPNLQLYWMLLNGERMPWNVLDYWQAQRYGLRHQVDSRVCLDDFNDIPAR